MDWLKGIQNDSVRITRVLLKHDEEELAMSILGAAFSTWCDVHEVPLSERKQMLKKLVDLQDVVK